MKRWIFLLSGVLGGCLDLPEGDLSRPDGEVDGTADATSDAAAGPDADLGACGVPTLDLASVLPRGILGEPRVFDVDADGRADVVVPVPEHREVRVLLGHRCGLRFGRLLTVPTVQPAWAAVITSMGDAPRVLVTFERVPDGRWRIELYLPEGEGFVRDEASTVPLPPLATPHVPGEAPTLLVPARLDTGRTGGLVFGNYRELWTLPSGRGPTLVDGLLALRREDGQFFEAVGLVGVPSPGGGGDALLIGEQTGFSLALNVGGGTLAPARTSPRGYNLKNYDTLDINADGLPDLIGAHVTEGGLARVYAPFDDGGDLAVEERVLPVVPGLETGTGPLVWDLAAGPLSQDDSLDLAVLSQGVDREDPRLYIASRMRYRAGEATVALGVVGSVDLRRPGTALLVGEFDPALPHQEVLVLEHETHEIKCLRWQTDRPEYCW